jgi:hypothetical protein
MRKLSALAVAVILLLSGIYYYHEKYVPTIEEAIGKTSISYDEIYHVTETKNRTVILYGKDDALSVGLLKKTFFGYEWVFGSGSVHFQSGQPPVSLSIANLPLENRGDAEQYVSVSFGVIRDDRIDQLQVKHNRQDTVIANTIDTPKGRIWYSFSETPISADPQLIGLDRSGNVVYDNLKS